MRCGKAWALQNDTRSYRCQGCRLFQVLRGVEQ